MHHTSASHKHIRVCILTRNMSEKCPKASPAFLFGEPPEFATEIIDLTWQKPRMSLDDSNPLPPFPLIEHKSVITACSRWECYYKAIYQERGVDGVLSLDGEVSLGYRGRFDVNFMLRCSLEWLAQKNRQLNSCRYLLKKCLDISKWCPPVQSRGKWPKYCFWYQIGNLRTTAPLLSRDKFDPKVFATSEPMRSNVAGKLDTSSGRDDFQLAGEPLSVWIPIT